MDAALANIGSHNARAVQIRKFVATPPARATTLRLVTAEDPPQTLGEWDVTQAKGNGSLSIEVSALLEEHTATVQRHTEAVLGWTQGDRVVASKRLRARYTPPADEQEDEDQLSYEALGISGTTQGQVIQMQRHIEARERTSNTFVHGLMQLSLQLNAQLQTQLSESYERIHELQRQQYESAAAAAAECEQIAAGVEPPTDEATEARTQALRVITGIAQQYGPTLIQVALARFAAPRAAIQVAAPASVPPSSPAPAPAAPAPPPTPVQAPAVAAAAVPTAVPASSAPRRAPARGAPRKRA